MPDLPTPDGLDALALFTAWRDGGGDDVDQLCAEHPQHAERFRRIAGGRRQERVQHAERARDVEIVGQGAVVVRHVGVREGEEGPSPRFSEALQESSSLRVGVLGARQERLVRRAGRRAAERKRTASAGRRETARAEGVPESPRSGVRLFHIQNLKIFG